MKTKLIWLVVAGTFAGFLFKAAAFNGTGHMTVAELAWRKMSSGEHAAVGKLLEAHPHYRELLAQEFPAGVDTNEWIFLRAATWPDMVRPARPGQPPKPAHITDYHRGDWHFMDLPFVAAADRPTIHAGDHPPKPTNAVERLAVLEAELRSSTEPASNRAVALCWYLHLLGDLHQPLHCASWFSPEFPHGDAGGNSVAIQPHTSPIKLHSFWDELLGTGESYTFLDHVADDIEGTPQWSPAKLKKDLQHKTYESWAQESFTAAQAIAYLDGTIQHAKWHDGIKADAVPDLDTSYESNARTMVKRRVALAGIRLGQKLKDIF